MLLTTTSTRRQHILSLLALGLAASSPARAARGEHAPFSWEELIAQAARNAKVPWRPRLRHAAAHDIDYDAVGAITYRPQRTIWGSARDPGIRLFPLSRFANEPVEIFIIEQGQARPFRYDPTLFDVEKSEVRTFLAEAPGFSGFRVMNPGGIGDWLAFQGASYFRSAGALDQYGLSARGLAIDTCVPGMTEEFPAFTRFWLERGPQPGGLTIYALLDSPSVSGAFRFENHSPSSDGTGVIQQVSSTLFARKDIAQLGIAPLTSMFWYGESDRSQAIDWRPEIHDSDGLILTTGNGEKIWRPLRNPRRAMTNSFIDQRPRGFGLMQRDRDFQHYQDDGVFYEKRPSLWVEPQGDWGKGAVILYEIPTKREYEDNIVCFWSPAEPFRAGQRRDFTYKLRWQGAEPPSSSVARVSDIWSGTAGRPAHDPIPNARKLVIDFAGSFPKGLSPAEIEPVIGIERGKILTARAYPVAGAKDRLRLTVDIQRLGDETSDLRVFLRCNGAALTETLIYQLDWN